MRTYFNILSYGRSLLGLAGMAVLFLVIYNVFSAVSLVSVIPFLEILFSEGAQPVTDPASLTGIAGLKAAGYQQLHEWIQTLGKWKVLVNFCVFLCLAIFIKNLSRYLASFFIAPFEQGIIRKMRTHIFGHMARLSMSFYTRHKKGDLIGILVSDVQVVQDSVIGTIQGVLREPITMLTFLVVMLGISWKLTLFTLIILPLTGALINVIAKSLKRQARQGQETLGELISIVDEYLGGVRIVKAFRKEAYEMERYGRKNEAYTRLQVGIRRKSELASPVTEVLSIMVICIIILYGGSMILQGNGQLTAAEFIGFIAVFSQFLSPIKVFANAISKIQKGMAAYQRIEGLLAQPSEVNEAGDPVRLKSFSDSLKFEGVWFRYPEEATLEVPGISPKRAGLKDVLEDIHFEVKTGQTLAIVGPSGGGKSTLVDLIPRFYDPTRGRILIDGIDIRELALGDLRDMIGYVTQEGILFHDTVLNNIAYGDPNPDRTKVEEAARIAFAHDFIMELPNGYDTLIGERGTMLSGGQRQRISIARAILRNPPILILDEATSNLDTESERWVQQALEKLMENRTSLVIAHRLSTIQHADEILVIESGRIVERGTHQDLLAGDGTYRKLHQLQWG